MNGILGAAAGDAIDPGLGITAGTGTLNDSVNANLPEISIVGFGLLAVGVIWRLVRRFTKG